MYYPISSIGQIILLFILSGKEAFMALTLLYVNKIVDDKFLNDGLSVEDKQKFVKRYKDLPIQKVEPKAVEEEYLKYSEEIKKA